jgi:hypothetical protein
MIIAKGQYDPAMTRNAVQIRVLDGVSGPIYARSFAVPDPKHSIDFSVREEIDLLCASQRCQSEILIKSWLENDVMLLEQSAGLPQI